MTTKTTSVPWVDLDVTEVVRRLTEAVRLLPMLESGTETFGMDFMGGGAAQKYEAARDAVVGALIWAKSTSTWKDSQE